MAQWLNMLAVVGAVFGVMGVGGLARRLNWLSEDADRSLLNLIVRILFPALILDVIMSQGRALLQPHNLVLPPLAGFVTVTGGFVVAYGVGKSLRGAIGLSTGRQWRTFALCVGIYNYGYIPIPLARQLPGRFTESTIAILFLHNLGVEIALWSIGIILISGHLGAGWWKRLLNGPTIAIAVAVLLCFTGMNRHVPPFAMKMISMLGASAIPLSLVMVGATLADEIVRSRPIAPSAMAARTVSAGAILRLGVMPVLFLLLAWSLPASCGDLKKVIALQAAMPCGIFPVVLSRLYDGDPPTALKLSLGTQLLSLATMPAWLAVGAYLFP